MTRLVGPNDDSSPHFPKTGHGNYRSDREILVFTLQVLPSVVDIIARQTFSKMEFYRNLKKIFQSKKYSLVVVKQNNIKSN
jgi:hypothetical protein